MDHIIVTIQENKRGKEFDLEIPMDQLAENMLLDVIQTIEGAQPELTYLPHKLEFFNERTGRVLDPKKTFAENAVWNGDILRLTDSQ